MDLEIRTKWVAALRSDEFKQGTNALRRVDGDIERFCCLGVLCELAAREGVIEPPRLKKGIGGTWYLYDGTSIALPPKVKAWMGGLDMDSESYLVHLNDNGSPFSRIADYIERRL